MITMITMIMILMQVQILHAHPEHANLIHANYIQEDAEFKGYEFEIGTTLSLGSGDLTLSFGRDEVDAEFSDGHNVPRINPQEISIL